MEKKILQDKPSDEAISSQDDTTSGQNSNSAPSVKPTDEASIPAYKVLVQDILPGGKLFKEEHFVDLVPFPTEFRNEDEALLSYNDFGIWHKVQFKILSRTKNE